jgi:tetratricopeptide (TPR) repeat protein
MHAERRAAPQAATSTTARPALWAALLVALTLLAYAPALRNGFIWDDDQYVTANRELRTAAGLASIWLQPGAPTHSYGQYYPLVHTSFWIEHHLWGNAPQGYHLVNVLLHALVALLAWRVLQRLAVPGAWLAAALFVLHPVQVETVAWITERKNLLSAALALGSALAWMRFAGLGVALSARRGRWYAASLALFLGALLSKTVACTLPVALLLVLAWKRGRITRRDVLALLPFVLAGLVLGLTTAWIERERLGASGPDWELTLLQRVLIAARALGFYAGKLLWPANLSFIYPRWTVAAGSLAGWLCVAGCTGVLLALWRLRGRLGAGPLVAMLFFALTLAPALGFVNVYPMRFSFVADHFQYLASLGPLALLAAGATQLAARVPPALRTSLAAALLLVLGTLSGLRLPAYRDARTLWLDTLERNPDCWMARNNLGMLRLQAGEVKAAIADFEAALASNPRHEKAQSNLGLAQLQLGHVPEAIAHYEAALRLQPRYPEAHNNLALALLRAGRRDEADVHLRQALEQAPDYAEAHYNLALLMLDAGRLDEALAHGQRAVDLEPGDARAHCNLGIALAQAGRLEEARAHFDQALRLEPGFAEARANLERARALGGR